MKILYISKSIIPSRTANSINVMKMCQGFSENGNEVILLAPDIKKNYEKNINDVFKFYGVKKNFKLKRLWHPDFIGGSFFYLLAIFIYLLINKKFDLVYGRFLHGCYIATLLKFPVIFEAHEALVDMKESRLLIFKKLIKNKYFRKLIVISQELKKMYLKNNFIRNLNIQVAHDGADKVLDFSQKVNLLGNKKNLKVGYVGHLYKGKGIEMINLIASKLSEKIDFHIIGGTIKDITYWKNKIKKNNVFFYGFISHQKIGNYINSLDVCLLPNQKVVLAHGSEIQKVNISKFTSPLKLFEYMSYRKPIIASDLKVIREILNEKNSILVKCNNHEEWIRAINKLKDRKKRENIAKQVFKDFNNYTWKNRARIVI